MTTKKAEPKKAPAKKAEPKKDTSKMGPDGLPADKDHPLYSPLTWDGNK